MYTYINISKLKYGILTLLMLLPALLFAQVRLTAIPSKTTVGTGEAFEVTFSVNANGENFTPPSLSGFEIVSGPNMSSSMTSINGNTTMSIGYSYDLVAAKTGEYTIGPASIVVNGKRLTSAPVRINVVKGVPVRQNAGGNQQQQNSGEPAMANPSEARDLNKQLFIKAEINRDHVYQGEQLVLSYKIYTRVNAQILQINKMPDFNGFWNQEITQPGNAELKTEMYNGQQYRVAVIKQIILFPDHAGDITIEPMEMTLLVQQPVPSNDPFDQFFGNQSFKQVQFKTKSNKLTVHAKPLPAAGQPAGYAGAVGKFNVSSGVDKVELKANEALNYNVKISGAGNIKLLKAPTVEFPSDFEKYDPKVTDSVAQSVDGVSGSRVYNFLLIPRHEGNYTIPPYTFSWFNPATNRYQTATTQPVKVKVNKGDKQNDVTVAAGQQDIQQLGKDIRYIKTNDLDLKKDGEGFFGSAFYYVLLLLGPLGFAGAWWYRRWNAQYNSDIVAVKSRKANKLAAKHLASAQQQLQVGNSKAFYEDVFKGLYGYLSYKLNIPVANLDKENIVRELQKRNVSEGATIKLMQTLDLCEMARYAPVTGISQQQLFEQAKDIINDMEEEI